MEQGNVTVATGGLHAKTAVLVKKQVVEKLALLFGKNSGALPSIKVPDSSVHDKWSHGTYLVGYGKSGDIDFNVSHCAYLNGRENFRDSLWATRRFLKKHPHQQSTWRHPHELVLVIYLQSMSYITESKFRCYDAPVVESGGYDWAAHSRSDLIFPMHVNSGSDIYFQWVDNKTINTNDR
jgi:hypothetical protein